MPRTRGEKRKFVQELIEVDDDFNGYEDPQGQQLLSQISIGDSLAEQEHEDLSVDIDTEQMSKMYKRLKEPDVWPQTFSKRIKERHTDIIRILGDARQRSVSDRGLFQQTFLPVARLAMADLETSNKPTNLENAQSVLVNSLGPEGQPFCQRLIEVFRKSDHLIVAYDQVIERAQPQNTLQEMETAFNEDKNDALNLLRACKAVVSSDVGRLMMARSQGLTEKDDGLSSEEERQARSLLLRDVDDQTPTPQGIGWNTMARNTEKAIKKLCHAATGPTAHAGKDRV